MNFVKYFLIVLAIIAATGIACNGDDSEGGSQYDTPPSCSDARGCA